MSDKEDVINNDTDSPKWDKWDDATRADMASIAHACNATAINMVELTEMMETLQDRCNREQVAILGNVIADLRQKAGNMVTT